MARKVLNKPVTSSGTAAIKSVATTTTTKMAITQDDNLWYNSNGFSATLDRQETDSKVLIDAPWIYTGTTHSYFAGMGIKTIHPNSNESVTNGWGYIWETTPTSDGNEGLFHCMKGMEDGHGLNNETGNHTFRIGRNTANTDNARPGSFWGADRDEDNRGHKNDMSHFTFIEISANNTSWDSNSGAKP
tara:strand:+ start:96 stop:659 length:564 start_codon:yes stop_codon:yes gene_type:complete